MMQMYIIAVLAALANAGVIDKTRKCINIRGKNYEEEELHNGIHNPYQLAIDYDTNTLFFSYTARTDELFKIAYLSLKTNDYGLVSGIPEGFANAVNSKSNEVYMGGEDGLYIFDYKTKSATKINGAINASIWQMFYKDGLYFTTYPNETALLYKNNKVVDIPELEDKVMVLAVKNNSNYVYANSSGLFTYDKALGKELNIGDYTVNAITADIDGNLYFSSPNAIYSIDNKSNKIERLYTSTDIYGLAIESNGNIIYAKEDSIVRLRPTTNINCINDNDIIAELTVVS